LNFGENVSFTNSTCSVSSGCHFYSNRLWIFWWCWWNFHWMLIPVKSPNHIQAKSIKFHADYWKDDQFCLTLKFEEYQNSSEPKSSHLKWYWSFSFIIIQIYRRSDVFLESSNFWSTKWQPPKRDDVDDGVSKNRSIHWLSSSNP
jgi:hypothetical protein